MNKYEIIQQIGDGTYGSVCKAVHRETGQLVAVKRMKQKYYSWQECIALPEVNVLRKLRSHPNVIKLNEVIRENNELFFVFEFMDGDLLGIVKRAKAVNAGANGLPGVPHGKVKSYMYQLLQALAHLHRQGYFHRDLKLENVLTKRDRATGFETVKVADFGLVKEVRARPPFTDYVSTRWYRAPEILLQDRAYNSPVDMWAAGCIMAELYTTRPLFPGANEVDQIFKICSVLGTPDERTWSHGVQLARRIRYNFPMIAPTPLRTVLAPLPLAAVDLITALLVFDPLQRLTAVQALQHPYFHVGLDEEPLAPTQAAAATPSATRAAASHSAPAAVAAAPPLAGAAASRSPGSSATAAAPPAQKPGSEGRLRHPPLVTATPSEDRSAARTNFSKFYLLPSPGAPGGGKQQGAGTSPPGAQDPARGAAAAAAAAARQTPLQGSLLPPAPTPNSQLRRGSGGSAREMPLKPLTRFSPTALLGGASPLGESPGGSGRTLKGITPTPTRRVEPLLPPGSNPATRGGSGGVDLDALMQDFAKELGELGPGRRMPGSGSGGPANLAAAAARPSPLGGDGGLADLLGSSRYRVSPMKGTAGGGGGPEAQGGDATPLSQSKRGVKALSPSVKVVLGRRGVVPLGAVAPGAASSSPPPRDGGAEGGASGGSLPFINRAPIGGHSAAHGGSTALYGRRAGSGSTGGDGGGTRLRPLLPDHEVK